MARSLLGSFVSGTRQMLSAQLFVSIGAVALAGWTLGITNDLIRERDRMRERVIQLEESLAGRGITVPATPALVDQAPPSADSAYPPSVTLPDPAPAEAETPEAAEPPKPAEPAPNTPTTDGRAEPRPFNPGQLLGELFAPPPPMRTIVLHVRAEEDAAIARRIASTLSQSGQVRVAVDVMAPRDPRPSGYAYFDGRQSRDAAGLVAQFNDIARDFEVAPWSAQLRGVALPAQGEYGADRLDIVLPLLPAREAPTEPQRIDPRTQLVRPRG